MRAFLIPRGSSGLDSLRVAERPSPMPQAGQVAVRMRAASLNYRDQAIVNGQYFGGLPSRDLVPLSDGAGEVVRVGEGVTGFAPGAKVAATFFQRPVDSPPTAPPAALGSPLDGVLIEEAVFNQAGLLPIPEGYSFEEAACLPCAAVTAWHALIRAGRSIRPGDTVLVLGTGGVSIFALQLALAAGARVIVTSSSDDKLARVTTMGASGTVNYKRMPEWDKEVLRLTGGRGVDCVVEVGGAGTLARSFQSLARGGKVCLIGVLTGREGDTNPYPLMMKGGSLHGIFVGDRGMFEELNRAIATSGIKPVVDRVFQFDEAPAAYRHHASGAFIGKVVIAIP